MKAVGGATVGPRGLPRFRTIGHQTRRLSKLPGLTSLCSIASTATEIRCTRTQRSQRVPASPARSCMGCAHLGSSDEPCSTKRAEMTLRWFGLWVAVSLHPPSQARLSPLTFGASTMASPSRPSRAQRLGFSPPGTSGRGPHEGNTQLRELHTAMASSPFRDPKDGRDRRRIGYAFGCLV